MFINLLPPPPHFPFFLLPPHPPQMGRGRTTTGTVIACLVLLRCRYGRPLALPPLQAATAGMKRSKSGSLAHPIPSPKPNFSPKPNPYPNPNPNLPLKSGSAEMSRHAVRMTAPEARAGGAADKGVVLVGHGEGSAAARGEVSREEAHVVGRSDGPALLKCNAASHEGREEEGEGPEGQRPEGNAGLRGGVRGPVEGTGSEMEVDESVVGERGGEGEGKGAGSGASLAAGGQRGVGEGANAKKQPPNLPALQLSVDTDLMNGDDVAGEGGNAEGDAGEDAFSLDDIAVVRKITRLLEHGAGSRDVLDAVIDRCAAMQNIREAILRYRRAFNHQEDDARARQSALNRGVEYLERYLMLIAFAAYLNSPAFEPAPAWRQMRGEGGGGATGGEEKGGGATGQAGTDPETGIHNDASNKALHDQHPLATAPAGKGGSSCADAVPGRQGGGGHAWDASLPVLAAVVAVGKLLAEQRIPFKEWLKRRPEIRNMKWGMRLRPARLFTVPVSAVLPPMCF